MTPNVVEMSAAAPNQLSRAKMLAKLLLSLKRLKEFELENKRLRQAVSDLTLDKQILAEAARGNF
jgi:hypothetical protein